MSDRTYNSNFVADKNKWPEYLMIGKLSAKSRQMPPTDRVIMVAHLSMSIMNHNIPET
jgi:hypothetical protein